MKKFFKKIGHAISKAVKTVVAIPSKVINTVIIKPIVAPALNYWKQHDPYVFPALNKGLQATRNFIHENRSWLVPVLITVVVIAAVASGAPLLSMGRFGGGLMQMYSTANTARNISNALCLFCAPTSVPKAAIAPTFTPTATFTAAPTSTPTFTPTPTNTPTLIPTATDTNTAVPVTKPKNGGGGSGGGGGGGGGGGCPCSDCCP